MDNSNLGPGEVGIIQATGVCLQDGSQERALSKLMLTNKNLILSLTVDRGPFKQERYVKRCPLSKIVDADGEPQVFVTKQGSDYRLNVVFDDEAITLRFVSDAKPQAQHWSRSIKHALEGNFSSIQDYSELAGSVASAVDSARSVVESVLVGAGGKTKTEAVQPKQKADKNPQPSNVTVKCCGCHAPLSGRAGATVICEYCDTKQTL